MLFKKAFRDFLSKWKRLLVYFILLCAWEIIKDRLAGWANSIIDENAGITVKFVASSLDYLASTPIGWSILLLVVLFGGTFIHSYVSEWGNNNKKNTVTARLSSVNGVPVEEEPIAIGFMDDGVERFDQSKVNLIDSLHNHLVTVLIPELDKYGTVIGWKEALSNKPKQEYMEAIRQFRLSVSKAFSDLLDIYNDKPFYDDIKSIIESFRQPFKEFGDSSARFFVLIKDKLDDKPSAGTVSLLEPDADKVVKSIGPCDMALKKMKKELEEMRKQESKSVHRYIT